MVKMLLGVAAVVGLTAAGAATPPGLPPAAASLEVRLIEPCQPGQQTYTLIGSAEELCLAKDKVFDGAAVVKIARYPTLPKVVMEISQAAADRLFDVTSSATSELRLGFVFNGRLIFAPFVGAALKLTELPITLKNDPDDIDALVAAFPGPVAAK